MRHAAPAALLSFVAVSERSPIRLPVGVRDFLPEAAARRRSLAEALLAEFERWGYDRIITPAFEYLDVLARGLGDGARAAVLRFVEPATGEVVALRPDITPQVARIAATRLAGARGPIRLCYEGSVLRLAPGARGQRELIQAGVELIEAPSPTGDAEVLALADAALRAADLDEVTLEVGHVALLRGALAAVEDAALSRELEALIRVKDEHAVAEAAAGRVAPKIRRVLSALPTLYGDPTEVLARARELPLDRTMKDALDELERTLALVRTQGATARLRVDLGEVRGFSYYTGIRFAGFVPGVGDAILLGGRYDDLIERFGRSARATGFAIDVESIAEAEQARGVDTRPKHRGVLVAGEGDRPYQIAASLRRLGHRAIVETSSRGAADLAAYAAQVGARAILVLDGNSGKKVGSGPAQPVAAALLKDAAAGAAEGLARELGLLASRDSKKGQSDGRRDHRRRPVG